MIEKRVYSISLRVNGGRRFGNVIERLPMKAYILEAEFEEGALGEGGGMGTVGRRGRRETLRRKRFLWMSGSRRLQRRLPRLRHGRGCLSE